MKCCLLGPTLSSLVEVQQDFPETLVEVLPDYMASQSRTQYSANQVNFNKM